MNFSDVVSLLAITISLVLIFSTYLLSRRVKLLYQAIGSKTILKVLRSSTLRRRLRRRYMIFEVLSEGYVGKDELERELRNKFKNLFGELHLTKSSLSIQYYDEKLRIGILRYNHVYRFKVLVALGLVRNVGSLKTMLIPIRTTGTLRKALTYVNKMNKAVTMSGSQSKNRISEGRSH